jgi:Holliday junction resolvase RusA-like endonuclease
MKCGECEHSKSISTLTPYSSKFCRIDGNAYARDHTCHLEEDDKPHTYKLTIPHELTDLNSYIQAERGNKFAAADIKQTMTWLCTQYAKTLKPIEKRVKIIFTWYCKNQKKDPDNISFAKKFILDGLVKAGVLENDGWKNIAGFEDYFIVDADKPRVEIEIREVGQ